MLIERLRMGKKMDNYLNQDLMLRDRGKFSYWNLKIKGFNYKRLTQEMKARGN